MQTPTLDTATLILAIGGMILAISFGGVAIMALRRRMLAKDAPASEDGAGMLDSLRAMRARGELSEEEFQSARAAFLSKAVGSAVPGAPDRSAEKARPISRGGTDGERRAAPGVDLTGAPLPRPTDRE